jgi:hypothetical protein
MLQLSDFNYNQRLVLWLQLNWSYILSMAQLHHLIGVTEPGDVHGKKVIVFVHYTSMLQANDAIINIQNALCVFMCEQVQVNIRTKITV